MFKHPFLFFWVNVTTISLTCGISLLHVTETFISYLRTRIEAVDLRCSNLIFMFFQLSTIVILILAKTEQLVLLKQMTIVVPVWLATRAKTVPKVWFIIILLVHIIISYVGEKNSHHSAFICIYKISMTVTVILAKTLQLVRRSKWLYVFLYGCLRWQELFPK